MSEVYQSLSRSKRNCKYRVIFVPKRRRKVLFGEVRQRLGSTVSLELDDLRCYVREQDAADAAGQF
jgi:REP element-mobilizing transposase RayT